ncbi:hypothetical protein Tco_0115976, partial [Tanacetum coccineum]
MLNDSTNQIPGSSSNPGSSTQPSFNQMPYYPNYQPQFATQEELLMFQQFKMQKMHQQQPQQLPNQFTTSQPHSEQQSHHLEVEDTEDEEEPLPTPTSKPSRGGRMKSIISGAKLSFADVTPLFEFDTTTPTALSALSFNFPG